MGVVCEQRQDLGGKKRDQMRETGQQMFLAGKKGQLTQLHGNVVIGGSNADLS